MDKESHIQEEAKAELLSDELQQWIKKIKSTQIELIIPLAVSMKKLSLEQNLMNHIQIWREKVCPRWACLPSSCHAKVINSVGLTALRLAFFMGYE